MDEGLVEMDATWLGDRKGFFDAKELIFVCTAGR
jgi:hypothetical protein